MPPTIITASNGNAFLASTIARVLSFDGTHGPLTAVHFADGGPPEIIGAETMLDAKRERDRIISEWHAATAKTEETASE